MDFLGTGNLAPEVVFQFRAKPLLQDEGGKNLQRMCSRVLARRMRENLQRLCALPFLLSCQAFNHCSTSNRQTQVPHLCEESPPLHGQGTHLRHLQRRHPPCFDVERCEQIGTRKNRRLVGFFGPGSIACSSAVFEGCV